ncbi:MAG: hypothetical protein JW860_06485 [Sedimentisphaerales bacterium]|nr:hypothetical protein [Sedimentisphaerales bacterium]
MPFFTGEYELTLDNKNRLFIPARLREQISPEVDGSAFFMVFGVNRIISLYPEMYYQRIALAVAPRMVAPDELLAFERINYSMAGRVELDRQGRVLLGEKAIRRAGIKVQVTLIGVRDHIEVWDKDYWDKYMIEHLPMHEQMLLKAREEASRKERETAGW